MTEPNAVDILKERTWRSMFILIPADGGARDLPLDKNEMFSVESSEETDACTGE